MPAGTAAARNPRVSTLAAQVQAAGHGGPLSTAQRKIKRRTDDLFARLDASLVTEEFVAHEQIDIGGNDEVSLRSQPVGEVSIPVVALDPPLFPGSVGLLHIGAVRIVISDNGYEVVPPLVNTGPVTAVDHDGNRPGTGASGKGERNPQRMVEADLLRELRQRQGDLTRLVFEMLAGIRTHQTGSRTMPITESEARFLDQISLDLPWSLVETFAGMPRWQPEDVNRGMDTLIARLREHGIPVEVHSPEIYLSIPYAASVRSGCCGAC